MLPLRKDFELRYTIYGEKYNFRYLEATAEESLYFYSTVNNTTDFLVRLTEFVNGLDSLTPSDKKKIMKSIYDDPDNALGPLYKQIAETRFRSYESKYKDVKNRPKIKGGGTIQGCEASTELSLSKETMIPINKLNKELTLYQRGRIRDGLLCNNLNSYKEGQEFNKKILNQKGNQDMKDKYSEKMESLAEKIENRLDRKKD